MTIKNVEIVQGSVKPINLVARLFEGTAKVTTRNGNGKEEKDVYFRVRFNHEYDPATHQFKPKVAIVGGVVIPWDYKTHPYESVVTNVEPASYNGDLSSMIRAYFDAQFKQQY